MSSHNPPPTAAVCQWPLALGTIFHMVEPKSLRGVLGEVTSGVLVRCGGDAERKIWEGVAGALFASNVKTGGLSIIRSV